MSGMRSKPVLKCDACGFKFFTITDTCWKDVDASIFLATRKVRLLEVCHEKLYNSNNFFMRHEKKFNSKITCRAELVLSVTHFFQNKLIEIENREAPTGTFQSFKKQNV